MASGFLVLPDGRCFSRRCLAFDSVLRVVRDHIEDPLVRDWFGGWIPGEDDLADVGYGPWVRASDQKLIERHIDLRSLTEQNQKTICSAVHRAAAAGLHTLSEAEAACLTDLDEMVTSLERGEPPLTRSDWRVITEPPKERIAL